MSTATETLTIHSTSLFPREDGTVFLARSAGKGYRPAGPEWPPLAPGQEVTVEDTSAWRWLVRITETRDVEHATGVVIGAREALPMPAGTDAGEGKRLLRLPNLSGHAHLRSWRTGDVVEHDGAYWRVTDKTSKRDHDRVYLLSPIDAAAYATRPGRVKLSSEYAAREALGLAVSTPSGEWLEVKEVKVQTHRDQEFGDVYGKTWWGYGKHVSEERAAKINALHPAHLSRDLHAAPSRRVPTPMPADTVQLIAKTPGSLAATGERVALVGRVVLHERTGDPDMLDSRYRYVVEIEADPDLRKRVAAFVRRAG